MSTLQYGMDEWMSEADSEKLKVLVVDDEEPVRVLMASMLGAKFDIVQATDGKEGLNLFRKGGIDLVFTDINMPAMSGIELLTQIHELEPGVPVILVTGFGSKRAAVDAVRHGAFDFVDKPFSRDQLMHAANRAEIDVLKTRSLDDARQRSLASEKLAAIGLMSSSIVHELMNPIAIIDGVARRIMKKIDRGQSSESEVRESCEKITELVARTIKVSTSLRNMVRHTKEKFEQCMVGDVVGDASELVLHVFRQKSIDFSIQAPEEAIPWECRRVDVSQVVLNLLNNATQAIESLEERWIRVEVEDAGDEAIIRVRDSGPGIPPDVGQKIFDMFFTTKPVGKGTGLGLATSRQIAVNHGGDLRLLPGPNTCFELRLPKKQQEEDDAAA